MSKKTYTAKCNNKACGFSGGGWEVSLNPQNVSFAKCPKCGKSFVVSTERVCPKCKKAFRLGLFAAIKSSIKAGGGAPTLKCPKCGHEGEDQNFPLQLKGAHYFGIGFKR